MRAMTGDPLTGEVDSLGGDSYYRAVEGCLIFFDLIPDERVVKITAIERPH